MSGTAPRSAPSPRRSASKTRSPADDGSTRERIRATALAAFAEMGYEAASTREIASRAGVNHGLIPYYFGTKEKLWRSAVDLAFEDLEQGLEKLLDDPSIGTERERAARMIRDHVDFVARRPEWVHLMHEEGKRRGPRMRWIVDRHVKPLYDALTRLFERAPGVLRIDVAPAHFFYILAGASSVIFHQAEECRRVSGIDPFDPVEIEAHADALVQLFLGDV